jgi:biotin carboxyl carrier protein
MSTVRYDVDVAGMRFPVDAGDEQAVRLAGSGRTADIVRVDAGTWSVITEGQAYTIHARAVPGGFVMRSRGPEVTVGVETERSRLLQRAGASAAKAEHGTAIVAPMPALVVRHEVTVGQEIVAGQGLVVLEAMKMENEIRSPRAGRVTALPAAVGKAVEKGEILVILE